MYTRSKYCSLILTSIVTLSLISCSRLRIVYFKNDLGFDTKMIAYINQANGFMHKKSDTLIFDIKAHDKARIFVHGNMPWDTVAVNNFIASIDSVKIKMNTGAYQWIDLNGMKPMFLKQVRKQNSMSLNIKLSSCKFLNH